MPVEADFPNPTIKIIVKGLVISAIGNGNPFAEVGALIESLCHKAKLIVERTPPGGSKEVVHKFHPNASVSLDVEGTSRSTIETYRGAEEFNRITGAGDENDFRWYVDIEADLHPGQEYTPKPGSLKPIFRFNNALCYSQSLSARRMLIKRGTGPFQMFGTTAEEIGASVYLDHKGSKAVLRVDGAEVLTVDEAEAKEGICYTIIFDCDCDLGIDVDISDFGVIYEALNPPTPADQRITFEAELVMPANPVVMCIGGNVARLKKLGA